MSQRDKWLFALGMAKELQSKALSLSLIHRHLIENGGELQQEYDATRLVALMDAINAEAAELRSVASKIEADSGEKFELPTLREMFGRMAGGKVDVAGDWD